MFESAGSNAYREYDERLKTPQKLMRFGIDFLDDALRGIFPDDLILIGAPSGLGKTQLCCNIAYANIEDGKRVHYIALEAARFEIERRLKFPLVLERFLADPDRPNIGRRLDFVDWLLGTHGKALEKYEAEASRFFEIGFKNLYVFYKHDKFNVQSLIETVLYCSNETDLIIIDHVHYFDFDDDNENRAIKEIAKTVRTLALEEQKPIILVAHLRKRDKQNDELVAGLDEFHGSSDLYKIATRVITMAPGRLTTDGNYETFFRIPKNRLDGGSTRFIGKEYFSPKRGGYEKGRYQIGWANQTRKDGFAEIDPNLRPSWARRNSGMGGEGNSDFKRPPSTRPFVAGR